MPIYESLKTTISKNKILVKNFSSLSLLQISQYVLPLITFPYLTRVLGPENYGLANFVFAFTAYFITISDYGFNYSAIKEISIFRDNKQQLRILFWSTILIKFALVGSLFFIYSIVLFSFDLFYRNLYLYLIGYVFVVGQAISPIWFLQGVERMIPMSVISIILKAISVISIFCLVTNSDQVLVYLLIVSFTNFLIGLSILFYTLYEFQLTFHSPSKFQLLRRLKLGWHLFLSNLSVGVYTTTSTFLLGVFVGNTEVGYFATAHRIKEAVQGILANFHKVVFPHLGYTFANYKVESIRFLKKYSIFILSLSFIFSVGLYVFSEEIVKILAGDQFINSGKILKIISFVPFIISLSTILGVQIMINLGFLKEFNKIITIAMLLSIITVFVLVFFFGAIGAAINVVIVESFVAIFMYRFVKNNELLRNRKTKVV